MHNKKHKTNSIATDVLLKEVEAKVMGNSGVPTAETDRDLLQLGFNTDGRPQMVSDKPKRKKKSNAVDIGNYMKGAGYESDLGKIMKELKRSN